MPNYAKNGPVGAPQNLIQRMKDSLMCVPIVVKTINLEILSFLTSSKNTRVQKCDANFTVAKQSKLLSYCIVLEILRKDEPF